MCLVVIDHHSALVGRSIPPDEHESQKSSNQYAGHSNFQWRHHEAPLSQYKRMCQKQSTKKAPLLLMIEADTMNVSGSYCVRFFCYHAACIVVTPSMTVV